MIKYFVSFSYQHGIKSGFGICQTERKEPIKDINDIIELSRIIEKDNGLESESVAIINWKKFEE